MIGTRKIILTGNISNLHLGDIVEIKGKFINFENPFPSGYNEKLNFFSKNIFNKFYVDSFQIHGKSISPYFWIRNFVFDSQSIYTKYTSLILLGIKNADNQYIYNITKELGITHLFVISGFHIGIIYFILRKLFNFFKINIKYGALIIIFILLFYLYLLNFPISATRAFFFLSMVVINKHFWKSRFTKIDILSFISILFILYNPFVIFSLSFLMSFLAMFLILFILKLNIKSSFTQMILITIILYFAMLPITINLNKYFSLFGAIFSLILTPIISVYYVITMFFFPFRDLMYYVFLSLEFILKSFSQINILIYVRNISFVTMFSYYIIYIICILYAQNLNTFLIFIWHKLL